MTNILDMIEFTNLADKDITCREENKNNVNAATCSALSPQKKEL